MCCLFESTQSNLFSLTNMKAQLGTIHLAAKNYGRNIPTERSGKAGSTV